MKSNRREGAKATETRKVPGDERRPTANQGGPGEMEVEGRPGVSTARSARPTRAAGGALIRYLIDRRKSSVRFYSAVCPVRVSRLPCFDALSFLYARPACPGRRSIT